MSEQITPSNEFEHLRLEAQTELLDSDGVFSLVKEALGFNDTEIILPEFRIDINYPAVSEEDAEKLSGDPDEYVGQGFVLTRGVHTTDISVQELDIAFSTFTYLRLGFLRKDQTSLALFDDAGRLHEFFPKDGNVGIMRGQIEERRVAAIQAWMQVNNKMIKAARENAAMHVDPMTNSWTDEPTDHQVL